MSDNNSSLSINHIASFLATTKLFENIPHDILTEIAHELKITYIASGDVLFEQNESADSLYVIMYGFLNVLKEQTKNKKKVVAKLGPGSVVGEIACIINVTRTATVYAVRDSILLQMTRNTFNSFMEKYPSAMMGITRQCVERLISPKSINFTKTTCFTLIPASNCSKINEFSQRFIKKIAQYGESILLTQDLFDEIHGKGAAQTPLDSAKSAEIISWIHEMESKYSFIIYVAESLDPWALRCIRQADKIVLVGELNDIPDLNSLEEIVFKNESMKVSNVDLVLLASSSLKLALGTRDWWIHRDIDQHYNIREGNEADFNRVMRILTGNGLGLVMSGGGSNALAHIGLIRALEELNIPIDYISGTSMGGIIGGLLAMELDYKSIIKVLTNVFYSFTAKIDYTLPISALLKGRLLGSLMRESYGEETRIEDLWLKFFCVSTNISTNELCVHENSLLWKAIRSSVSLPAIFPAVHDEKQLIYVDGGVLNNLPVDIMQDRINGGKIIASSVNIKKETSILPFEDDTTSGWYLFLKHVLIPKLWKSNNAPKKDFINIASVIHNSISLASNKHQQKMLARADYPIVIDIKSFGLLNFKPMQEIIDIGYKQAMENLRNTDLIKIKK